MAVFVSAAAANPVAIAVATAPAAAPAAALGENVSAASLVVAGAPLDAGGAVEPAAPAAGEAAAPPPRGGHAVPPREHEDFVVVGDVGGVDGRSVVVTAVVVSAVVVAVVVGGVGVGGVVKVSGVDVDVVALPSHGRERRRGVSRADDLREPVQHQRDFRVIWRDGHRDTSARAQKRITFEAGGRGKHRENNENIWT